VTFVVLPNKLEHFRGPPLYLGVEIAKVIYSQGNWKAYIIHQKTHMLYLEGSKHIFFGSEVVQGYPLCAIVFFCMLNKDGLMPSDLYGFSLRCLIEHLIVAGIINGISILICGVCRIACNPSHCRIACQP